MPDPDTQREFQKLVPDAPERFLRIVESQTVDVSKREDRMADAEIKASENGFAAAVAIAIMCVLAAIGFFAARVMVAGYALLGFPVVLLIQSFLRNIRRND